MIHVRPAASNPLSKSTKPISDAIDAHIRELTSGQYNVMALPEIVAAIRNGRELPNRTIAITIDDAYLSVYTEA